MPLETPDLQTNWNEAVIERLDPATMTTSLIPFALGKLVLDHDVSQDRELMPGDVITIYAQSDIQIPIHEQVKYITLEGEFVHPGVYSVQPGETLRSLVARAGGLTNEAYIYAAVFTRRSTQLLEQQRLNEIADQLEHDLLRNSPLVDANPGGTSAQQAQQAELINRQLINRFHNVRATGRIVLESVATSAGKPELPNLALEDGDHFIVPFKPETVQVLGAVYNPHAFIFQPKATAKQYLRLAGGPNRDADRKRIFILRADGSVTGAPSARNMFSSGISDIRLRPGDTIVVPEKKLRSSVFNQALGWAQAVSQTSLTALGAAALSTR